MGITRCWRIQEDLELSWNSGPGTSGGGEGRFSDLRHGFQWLHCGDAKDQFDRSWVASVRELRISQVLQR